MLYYIVVEVQKITILYQGPKTAQRIKIYESKRTFGLLIKENKERPELVKGPWRGTQMHE